MNNKKLAATILIGQIAEWYDFTLYGFLIPIISHIFFPTNDPKLSLLAAVATFSVGLIVRPIGGLVLGYIGDTKGRKNALVLSLFLMGVSTVAIGFLPTYQSIGLMAPILLIMLRIIQGFSCGGEFIGSIVFTLEHRKATSLSVLPWMGALTGTLLSSLIIMLLNHANSVTFETVLWRVPFLIGGIVFIIGLYLRMNLSEGEIFKKLKAEKKIVTTPIFDVIKKNYASLIRLIFININLAATSYLAVAFMSTYLKQFISMPFSHAIMLNTLLIFLLVLFIPLSAAIGKKIKHYETALAVSALLLMILAYPIYNFLMTNDTLLHILAIFLFAVSLAPAMAFIPLVIIDILPPGVRYSGLAISYNITYSIFGGLMPFIATYLIGITHSAFIPAYIIMISSLFTLIGLFHFRQNFPRL